MIKKLFSLFRQLGKSLLGSGGQELGNELSAPYEVPQFPIEQIESKIRRSVSFFINERFYPFLYACMHRAVKYCGFDTKERLSVLQGALIQSICNCRAYQILCTRQQVFPSFICNLNLVKAANFGQITF